MAVVVLVVNVEIISCCDVDLYSMSFLNNNYQINVISVQKTYTIQHILDLLYDIKNHTVVLSERAIIHIHSHAKLTYLDYLRNKHTNDH